jgi:hypothetical protein
LKHQLTYQKKNQNPFQYIKKPHRKTSQKFFKKINIKQSTNTCIHKKKRWRRTLTLKSSSCWCGGPCWSVSGIAWEWKKKQLINLTKLKKKYKEEGDYLG